MTRFFLGFAGLILIAACSSGPSTFSSEKVEAVDFSAYKTYAFLPTKDTAYSRLISRQKLIPILVRQATSQLAKKGLALDTLNPDCLFTYTLLVKQTFSTSADKEVVYNPQVYNSANLPPTGMYGGSGYIPNTPSIYGANTNIYYFSSDNRPVTYQGKMTLDTLREGSMVIDMIDAKSKKIIWRSIAQSKHAESERIKDEKQVEAVLAEMFKKLPRK